jgi:hypothetical protein
MDKDNLVYIHSEILFTTLKNEILLFVTKCMELKDVILSEISQTEKAYAIYFCIWKQIKTSNKTVEY